LKNTTTGAQKKVGEGREGRGMVPITVAERKGGKFKLA